MDTPRLPRTLRPTEHNSYNYFQFDGHHVEFASMRAKFIDGFGTLLAV